MGLGRRVWGRALNHREPGAKPIASFLIALEVLDLYADEDGVRHDHPCLNTSQKKLY